MDGAPPLHAQLVSISQAGARAAGGESQLWGVSPRTRHSQSPLSLPEPGQTSVLLQPATPGSMAPTAPNSLILIVSERKMERGRAYENTHRLYKLKTTYTTCNILMVELRAREMKRERDREGGSYNLFSVCDCISTWVILFFTHVTHTGRTEAQWGNHNINSA